MRPYGPAESVRTGAPAAPPGHLSAADKDTLPPLPIGA